MVTRYSLEFEGFGTTNGRMSLNMKFLVSMPCMGRVWVGPLGPYP